MSDITGTIFKIRRFSIHDGPGIRTSVFLKGCPLECIWCHSPEGISPQISIWHETNSCIGCGECVNSCPENALTLISGEKHSIKIDRTLCKLRGECVSACPSNAIGFTGYTTSVQNVIREIEKDMLFYDESGGGVTLTGGEPLYQPEFSAEILRECKKRGINTVMETSLYCDENTLMLIAEYTDHFLADFKLYDKEAHIKYTGKSNEIIKENLRLLIKSGKKITVRIPLIRSVTESDNNISSILKFLKGTDCDIPVEYINFNPLAGNNYQRLGLPYLIK